jgi:signal transduction histidine kinase
MDRIEKINSGKPQLRKLMYIIVAGFVFFIIYFLGYNYFHDYNQAEKSVHLRLVGIANTLSIQIDGEKHQQLVEKYPNKDGIFYNKQDSVYNELQAYLESIRIANSIPTPIYTYVKNPKGDFSFIVTSNAKPYFRHEFSSKELSSHLVKSDSGFLNLYKDMYGLWYSAFAPIKNSKAQIVGYVQVDQRFKEFSDMVMMNIWKNLFLSVVVLVLLFFLLLRVIQPLIAKEEKYNLLLESSYREKLELSELLQKNLDKANSLDAYRREMVANLSHDLRTPITNILGYLETIVQKKIGLSETDKEKYTIIALKESKRLNQLVSNLFDLSKLQMDEEIINKEPFNILELAQDIVQKYQLFAKEKGVELITDFQEDIPLVYADIQWIDRVIQNIFDNALRHSFKGGFIKFTIGLQEAKVFFKICNNGEKITTDRLEHVFDRFYTDTNTTEKGTGLGLAIVKKIIELHEERVWAEYNENITTFAFTLPIYSK